MTFLKTAFTLLAAASTASAIVLPPESVLPFDIDLFKKAGIASQWTNCALEYNQPGVEMYDLRLNATCPYGPDSEARVNLYTSKQNEIIVAYEGMNGSNPDSTLHVAEFWLDKCDPVLGLSSQARVFHGVHAQFLRSWAQIQSPLSKLIQDYPDRKVLVVGHSLGASMCQLAALAIHNTFGDVISNVIGLGPPRIGNRAYGSDFDAVFKGRYSGVINGRDGIPRLPLQIMGYHHPSGMVWINPANSSSYHYYTNGEDPRGPDSVIPKFFNIDEIFKGHLSKAGYSGDHLGIYFGVHTGGAGGNCTFV